MVAEKHTADAPVSESKTDDVVAGGFRSSFAKKYPNWWRWAIVLATVLLVSLVVMIVTQLSPAVSESERERVKAEAARFSTLADAQLTPAQAKIRFEALYGVEADRFSASRADKDTQTAMSQAKLLSFSGRSDAALAVLKVIETKDATVKKESNFYATKATYAERAKNNSEAIAALKKQKELVSASKTSSEEAEEKKSILLRGIDSTIVRLEKR